jgi:HD-GYP domain-containing protein (c-di-GMP phosphodiesterase class II)
VMQNLYLQSLASRIQETENAFENAVLTLARASEANYRDAGNHVLRVGEYCTTIARRLGMPEKFCNIIRVQSALHDVGNLHINPDILNKPGKLSDDEFQEIKKHPLFGSEMLGNHTWFTMAKNAALSHHEKWDGSGYPYGLRGKEIPLEGRILNIADQYDVLRNARVYKPSLDHQAAYKIITEGNGRTLPDHFDPQVLRVFKEAAPQLDAIYEKLKDS